MKRFSLISVKMWRQEMRWVEIEDKIENKYKQE